jgi:catechol 2,3-dioxygenase-like lactoylglutathione lyase family enzyme
MSIKLRHVCLIVNDLANARYFYKDLLGFEEVSSKKEYGNEVLEKVTGIKPYNIEWIKLKGDGKTLLELIKFDKPLYMQSIGMYHIALTVNNIQKVYETLIKANVKFVSEPLKKDGVKLCFCRDYDSNLIEIVEEIK